MAWYDYGDTYFRPYASVATKKALSARALARLMKKSKRTPEPGAAHERPTARRDHVLG